MSSGRNPFGGVQEGESKGAAIHGSPGSIRSRLPLFKDTDILKDSALLLGWIVGLILLAGLFWFLTYPVRSLILRDAVNRVFEQNGDSRHLDEPVYPGLLKTNFSGMSAWFTVVDYHDYEGPNLVTSPFSKGTTAFIFAFIGEGSFFPCAAIVTARGEVEEFIPLNSHGERMIKRVSPGIIELYTRRIERIEGSEL